MTNWKTGNVVGWWEFVGDDEVESGLQCNWMPFKEQMEGGQAVPVILDCHKQSEGYWFMRVPRGGGGRGGGDKVLFHRQLWQDLTARALGPGREVHHRDGHRGNNCQWNLEEVAGRDHRRLHGRQRRVVRWGARVRAPRRQQRRN